jgi:radical SAM protein (TIGR01212 family)
MENKWNDGYYIAYFQANTNTHGSLDKLKYLFEKAISLSDNIVMLSIATRPDSLPIEVLDYLAELNKKVKVQVELGLQTIHEETSILINRCHDLITFDHAVKALRKRDIEVVVHIINGLPGESSEMMLDTVKHLNTLDIQGIKIHMLHIIKKTKMGFDYQKNPWPLLSLNEYRDIVTDQLRHLRKDIIVHRITGDAKKEDLIAPLWTLKKFVVSNEIDKYMRANLYYQGDLYESQSN